MKNIKFLLLFLLGMISSNLFSQVEKGLKGTGIADGSELLLRWGFTDTDSYLSMINNGVKLIRTEVNSEGFPIVDTVNQTVVVLENNLSKYTETVLDGLIASGNERYSIVKNLTYEVNTTLKDGVTLRDLINYRDTINSKMFFTTIMADQDFEIAKSLGMAYVDNSAVVGKHYVYTVSINNTDTTKSYISANILLALDAAYSLQAPDKPTGVVGDSVVTIAWDTDGLLDYYTFYDIERSDDAVNYQKVNDAPFAFTPQEGYEGTMVYYQDSLPSNGANYYYKIRGISLFNKQAPASEFLKLVGVPKRLAMQARSPAFFIDDNDHAVLTTQIPSEFINELSGYNVYRKDNAKDVGEQLNTTLIPITDSVYIDLNTQSVGYYYSELIDINGHNYPSTTVMVQLNDTIPPAVPTNLSGFISDDGQVVLEWDMNTEEDFNGYKVFTSNSADTSSNGVYTEVTKKFIRENKFSYFIKTEFNAEDIYFKVLAFDNRDNYSEMSASVLLKRPDHFPPSAPLLHRLMATSRGIELGWVLSPDDDVVKHVIQRKEATASAWEDLLIIDQNNPAPALPVDLPFGSTTTWIDKDQNLKNVWYNYRVIAVDDANNMSGSKFKKVRPYISRHVDAKFKSMTAVRLDANSLPPFSILKQILPDDIRITIEELEAAGSGGVGSGPASYMTKVLELYDIVLISWVYTVDDNSVPESFKFYKSGTSNGIIGSGVNGAPITQADIDTYTYPFVMYKNIPESVIASIALHYNYTGYMYLDIFKKPKKEALDVDYKWKLMGMHDLGRYSPFSPELLLVAEGS